MRKFNRGTSPDFLNKRWRIWGKRYKANRKKNQQFLFQWPVYNKKRINVLLEPVLATATNEHCSYCDNFPIRSHEDSIDHFKPKSKSPYYELVCQWENLYYCCHNCQQSKKEQYNQFLLRPDSSDYLFQTYFIYSFRTHEIEVNPILTPSLRKKAETTLRIFGFNDKGHVAARRISLERYENKRSLGENIDINDFPYRFTLE